MLKDQALSGLGAHRHALSDLVRFQEQAAAVEVRSGPAANSRGKKKAGNNVCSTVGSNASGRSDVFCSRAAEAGRMRLGLRVAPGSAQIDFCCFP
jgi:hypothetical protein